MRVKQPSGRPEGPVQGNGERLGTRGRGSHTAGMRGIKCTRTVARKQRRTHRSAHLYEGRCRAMSNAQPTAGKSSTSSRLRGLHEPHELHELSSTSSTSSET